MVQKIVRIETNQVCIQTKIRYGKTVYNILLSLQIFFPFIAGIRYFEFDRTIYAGDKSTQKEAKRQDEPTTISLTVIDVFL